MTRPTLLKNTAAFAAIILAVAACTTSTPYGPMDGRYGYSDQRIEQNRYRVVFKGNSYTPRETVENYLLFRAAELTVQLGYDHFVVVERETETKTTYQRIPAVYGYYPYGFHRFPYYAYGYPWAYDATTREWRRYEAIAYIVMYSGEKPMDEPNAYDAREVMRNLGPVIERPPR